jgi:hypothetical protein
VLFIIEPRLHTHYTYYVVITFHKILTTDRATDRATNATTDATTDATTNATTVSYQ